MKVTLLGKKNKGVIVKTLQIIKSARVDSSVIAFLKYNKINKKLTICFNSGAVYIYSNCPRNYARFLFGAHENGFSVGHVFNALIKDNDNIPYRTLGKAQMEFSLDNII